MRLGGYGITVRRKFLPSPWVVVLQIVLLARGFPCMALISNMAMLPEIKIDRFDGGIANDPRDPRESTCRMVTNFDILTDPKRLIPYNSAEDGDDAAATSQKQNFCIGYKTAGTDEWVLLALGVKSGASTAEVLYKSLTT